VKCRRIATRPQDAAKALEKKPAKRAAFEKLVSEGVERCLVEPFVEAAAAGHRNACTALARAWTTYLACMQAQHGLDEGGLVDLAIKARSALLGCTRPWLEVLPGRPERLPRALRIV
jgi:hypothetical protein